MPAIKEHQTDFQDVYTNTAAFNNIKFSLIVALHYPLTSSFRYSSYLGKKNHLDILGYIKVKILLKHKAMIFFSLSGVDFIGSMVKYLRNTCLSRVTHNNFISLIVAACLC